MIGWEGVSNCFASLLSQLGSRVGDGVNKIGRGTLVHVDGDVTLDGEGNSEDDGALGNSPVRVKRLLALILSLDGLGALSTHDGGLGERKGKTTNESVDQRTHDLNDGVNTPDGRDLILMLGHETANDGTRGEEEDGGGPHSEKESGKEEHEEMQLESRSEVILISVLHRELPCEMEISLESASVDGSTHGLSSDVTHDVTLGHPEAVGHVDTSKSTHSQDEWNIL